MTHEETTRKLDALIRRCEGLSGRIDDLFEHEHNRRREWSADHLREVLGDIRDSLDEAVRDVERVLTPAEDERWSA
jgi:hypothetical protein